MSLTRGGGPLATPGPADVNYTLDGPAHRLLMQPFPRRVRMEVGGATVLDTERGQLLHESNLKPVLYAPREDVTATLERTETITHCPFKGDASHFAVAGVPDAVWAYEDPILPWLSGLVAFYAGKVDRLLDEDEPVRALCDPYHRCDVRRRGRELILSETGLPNRIYVAREDVTQVLERSEQTTHCPYKGDATYWHVDGRPDAAWSYEEPFDAVRAIAGYVSFVTD